MVSGSKNFPEESNRKLAKKFDGTNPLTLVLEKYLVKFFHELLAKDGTNMDEWNKFAEKQIYEDRFVESVQSRLHDETKMLFTFDEFQVFEAFVKVLAMQVYEEEGPAIRYELKISQANTTEMFVELTETSKSLVNNLSVPQLVNCSVPSSLKCSVPPPPPPLPPLNLRSNHSSGLSDQIPPPPPPPPLPPSIVNSVGPPAAPNSALFGSVAPRRTKSSIRALRRLKIPTLQQVSSNSLWAVADNSTLKEAEDLIPIKDFESLFCASIEETEGGQALSRKESERRKASISGPTVICLLDTKRSTNISISLSQIRTFPEIQSLFTRIESADTTISEDLLNSLIKCEPSAEEIEIVHSYDGDFELLNTPEKFVLEFSRIENMSWMMRVLRYMHRIPIWATELIEGIEALKDNFWILRHSQLVLKLMVCLKRLYELNNVVYGHQRPVQGISFEGILEFAKVTSVPDNEAKVTMLEFLETRMPGISDRLQESVRNIDKAIASDWDVLASNLTDLKVAQRFFFQNPHESTRPESFMRTAEPFFTQWAEQILKIDRDLTDCRSAWLDLCEYFQEDPEAVKPNEFLQIWAELVKQLDLAKQKRLQSS